MRIDLSCPAEIFRVELPTAEIPAAGLMMFNLSDRVIVSAEVTLRLLTASGGEQERLVYRARALNGRPHSTFRMNVPCTPADSIRSSEVTIEKVWFADNAVWRRESGQAVEYTPNDLPISRGLSNLKYVAGETAVGYPSEQEGLWLCVCGRPNPDDLSVCARCRREKSVVFARFNREAVEKQLFQKERQLELQSRTVREDTARLQRIREAEYNETRHRRGRRVQLCLALLFALVLCAGCFFGLAPLVRLREAEKVMEAGALETAEAVFADLGSFPGAADRLADCRRRISLRDARESQDPAVLQAAIEALRSTQNEEDLALAREAALRRGRLLLDAGSLDEARQAVDFLPGEDAQRTELLKACDYAEASENMDQRYYVLARQGFLALGDYLDAADRADACIYLPALEMIEQGEYDSAIIQLSRIPAYSDSSELLARCYYLKGEALEADGSLEGAYEAFRISGTYLNAQERATALARRLAESAFASADFEKAMTYFALLEGDEEAHNKYLASAYTLARRAVNSLENRRALELLALLPEDYEDAADLRARAVFSLGSAALNRQDWQEAVSWLDQLPADRAYRSAQRQARYELALVLLAEAQAAESVTLEALLPVRDLLERAEGYEDAEKQLRQVENQLLELGWTPPEATAQPTEEPEPSEAPETEAPAAETPAATAAPTPAPTPAPSEAPAATGTPAQSKSPVTPTPAVTGSPFARPGEETPTPAPDAAPTDSFLVSDEE